MCFGINLTDLNRFQKKIKKKIFIQYLQGFRSSYPFSICLEKLEVVKEI